MPAIQDIYSVNVSNRYELQPVNDADEESDSAADYDPLDTLKSLEDQKKRAQEEAKKKKQAAAASKGKNQKKGTRFKELKDANVPVRKEEVSKPTRPQRQREDRNEGLGTNNRRGGDRSYHPEGDENRRPPRRRNEHVGRGGSGEGDQTRTVKDDSIPGRIGHEGKTDRSNRAERYRGGRGGFRNNGGSYRGRGYGGYRNDGRDDRGKREFDRRSGSDRSSVRPLEKRDGAGSRNWGIPGKEIEETPEAPEVVEEPEPTDVDTEEKDAAKKEESEVEAEPSEMTLDEWKAKQASQLKAQSFNIRKAGEGENVDQWKDMKMLRKNTQSNGQNESTIKEPHKRPSKPQVNVNIQFGDNAPRGFGGRGRGRGRGPRGQRFGSERTQRQMLPDVQNEQEFPTLG